MDIKQRECKGFQKALHNNEQCQEISKISKICVFWYHWPLIECITKETSWWKLHPDAPEGDSASNIHLKDSESQEMSKFCEGWEFLW